ncbi:MAG: glycoside hydrolase [Actinomycetia bacterium]|nr:glycoside hydrolase [Actinomycetes bacterium]
MAIRVTRLRYSRGRTGCGAVAVFLLLVVSIVGEVRADPAADALSRLAELSRQAVQSREAVTSAQLDLDTRLAAQTAAEERHRADLAALEAANSQLQAHQRSVDRVAASMYVSGRSGWLAALLTADSPQQLIDQIWLQRTIPERIADQVKAFQAARERAASAARASEISAADALAAVEWSAAVRRGLQAKWSELQRQIADAEAQYAALTPQQRAVFDNPATAPPPASSAPAPADPAIIAMPTIPAGEIPPPSFPADVPEALPVGVASETGLQANTVLAARAVSARFPEIAEIGGVRPDSKPWHPNGLAIDVMIPNPGTPEGVALGNEILTFVMSNAGRFGLQDAIWGNTYYTPGGPQGSGYGHNDHVHITTTPSG